MQAKKSISDNIRSILESTKDQVEGKDKEGEKSKKKKQSKTRNLQGG